MLAHVGFYPYQATIKGERERAIKMLSHII